MATTHDERILDQFTRQAVVFNAAPALNQADALAAVVAACLPRATDRALDVACGGGIVACTLAPHVKEVIGCDVTPAMLENARERSAENELNNASFIAADALQLPFPDQSFDIVTTRFSFHHVQDPLAVLREMFRVSKPEGRVVVIDMYVSSDTVKAEAFNKLETLRDPSHVRVLELEELAGMFESVGLPRPARTFYSIADDARNLLARSFPEPGDDVRALDMFRKSAADGSLGIEVVLESEAIMYKYPVVVLAATRT